MDNPDEILKKHWLKKGSVTVGKIIGSGGFGRVYAGWYNGLKVAIKDYGVIYDELNWDDKMDIMEEFSLMKDLNHTNTVRVYGFIMNRGCIALVMEYADRGSLKRFIEKKSFRSNVWLQYHVLLQIALAMRFIHNENILHRDLKPDNILVFQDKTSNYVIKISDFGESRRFDSLRRSLTKGKGTFTYMDKAAVKNGNNMATDFYSFCVLAFEVLSGELIPVIPHLDALLKRENPTIPEKVPDELRECLMSGFDEDQTKRASWTKTIIALQNSMDSANGGGRKNSTNSLDLKVEAFPKSGSSRQIALSTTKYLNRFNFRNKYFIFGLIAAVLMISAGISLPIAISLNSSTSTTEMESTTQSASTSSSGTSKPPPLSPWTKLLVASGIDFNAKESEESFVYNIEVIDLLNSNRTCKEWAALPHDFGRTNAKGGFVDEGLLVCGGEEENDELSRVCHHITNNNTVLLNRTNISFDVGFIDAGSVVLDNNKLFVTGGYSDYGSHQSPQYRQYLKSTKYVSTTDLKSGPQLPEFVRAHCIIEISDDLLMLTGGEFDFPIIHTAKETWFFSRINESWTLGPDLIDFRSGHECDSFIDVTSNDIWLVVSPSPAGTNGKFLFLNFNQEPHKWIHGPSIYDYEDNLTLITDGFKLVSGGTYLHFINTFSKEIFKLDCATCDWVLQEQTLKYTRQGAVVSLIPDNLSDCS